MADSIAYWGRTALYRLFDTSGDLLYVGIANNPESRWKQHSKTKDWWHLVAEKTTCWFEKRIIAADAEVEAIHAEKPRFNLMHALEAVPQSTRTVGVAVRAVTASYFQAGVARQLAVARDARFELDELPITYVEHRGVPTAALVPAWAAEWLRRHADEVIASLKADV